MISDGFLPVILNSYLVLIIFSVKAVSLSFVYSSFVLKDALPGCVIPSSHQDSFPVHMLLCPRSQLLSRLRGMAALPGLLLSLCPVALNHPSRKPECSGAPLLSLLSPKHLGPRLLSVWNWLTHLFSSVFGFWQEGKSRISYSATAENESYVILSVKWVKMFKKIMFK
jgi:hypothetical protein